MKPQEILTAIQDVTLDDEIVSTVNVAYDTDISTELAKIISLAKDGEFYDNGNSVFKQLSVDDILYAYEDLEVDFIEHGIIPIFDTGDNDYICYKISDKT